MKQITQKLKSGKMAVMEVPTPCVQHNHLLIRNHYSLISAGTEGSTVRAARKGYIGKAKERPQQVKQVIETLRTQGPVQTYRAVMKKLDAYSPLGYSCAGEVIDPALDVNGFAIGDLVACGGFSASHAQIVNVPINLCVKLKPHADLKQAAYNTLGAIALQGVRQADLRLGETCAVIGLGLLGQLTGLLLRAAGIQVVGVDINAAMVDVAQNHCADLAFHRDEVGIEGRILDFTGGLGCDAVIITAESNSLDPINFSGAIARKKGTIVVVGMVPTGFDREPYFYKKELQVKMSCSYGPGRYDPAYEEKGVDYPAAYVRWTENRNMQAFQDLIQTGRIDVGYLTTHTFKLDQAPSAYDMLVSRSEPFIGILIEYDVHKKLDISRRVHVKAPVSRPKASAANIGFIGAGSYAQSHLLPNIPKKRDVNLVGVMTASSAGARSVADRFGFQFCTTNEADILKNDEINTVFIATRHDTHAEYVIRALKAGKHVFVEKPLCLKEEELQEIASLMSFRIPDNTPNLSPEQPVNDSTNNQILMVGYNRRFSPLTRLIKEAFANGPMAMIYRINAGYIPGDLWIQDPEFGGGRIIGEVCHFVDLLTYINGSLPVPVYAAAMETPDTFNDVVTVSMSYENGSIGTVCYFANGDRSLPKERIEIYRNGATAVLDDFKTLALHIRGKKKEKRLMAQDKGQKNEVRCYLESVLHGKGSPISFEEIYSASLTTLRAVKSIQTRTAI